MVSWNVRGLNDSQKRLVVLFLFFIFISNKDVYSRILPHVESHKAEVKKYRETR